MTNALIQKTDRMYLLKNGRLDFKLWRILETKIKGTIAEERFIYQVQEWVKGNPIHNEIDDACVPDYSCCVPQLATDQKTKDLFLQAFSRGDYQTTDMIGSYLMQQANCFSIPKHRLNIINHNKRNIN